MAKWRDSVLIKQFDFSRNWKKLVDPHLKDPFVKSLLNNGMISYAGEWWTTDKQPSDIGRGKWNGYRVVKGKLSSYQPIGRCHWIASFVLGLAIRIYPNKKWHILSGDIHTVIVDKDKTMVFDILQFKHNTAEESIKLVNKKGLAETIELAGIKDWLIRISTDSSCIPLLKDADPIEESK